jgi:hypothetical protein
VLKEEAEVREREAQELRLAAGAFPALSGGVGVAGVSIRGGGGGGAGGGGRGARGGGPGFGPGHRVLLVDSRTKRVKVESYSRSGGLESEDQEEDVAEAEAAAGMDERVPPPAREVEFVRVRRGPATRWVDLKGGDGTVKYVALRAAA